MRTTIHIPDDVHRRVKVLAAKRGSTLTAFILDAVLRQLVKDATPAPAKKHYRIRVHKSGDINPAFVGKSFGEIEAMLDELDPPFAVRELRRQQQKKKRARS